MERGGGKFEKTYSFFCFWKKKYIYIRGRLMEGGEGKRGKLWGREIYFLKNKFS